MRARGVIAAVAAVGLAVSGCTSGSDDGALELDDVAASPTDDATEPATEPPVEETEEPEDPPEEDEPLFPPLPPLEPDPDSDIPLDQQEYFFDLYADYHEVKNSALSMGVANGDLERVAAQGELRQLMTSLEAYEGDGTALGFADTEIVWVKVAQVEGGQAVVQECRIDGPGSGLVDASTRERVGEPRGEGVARLLQARFALVELDDGTFEHRVVEFLTAEDEDRCGA